VNRRSFITPFGRVGSGEQHRWHFEAKRLRGLEVPKTLRIGWVSAISLRQSLMID
jgi:hypothetical protein